MVMEVLNVHYHDHHVGAASFDPDTGLGAFAIHPRTLLKPALSCHRLKCRSPAKFTPFPS